MSKSTIVKFALAISFFPAVAGFVFQISEEADIKPLLLWFRISILVSLILGFIILLGLIFAERYLSAHRSQLGTLFTGGLYGVTFGALILVVCNSILILLSIWLFLKPLVDFSPTVLVYSIFGIFGIVVTLIVSIFTLTKALLTLFRRNAIEEVAFSISRTHSPALWTLVDSLSQEMEVAPPDQIIAGINADFFVTEIPINCVNALFKGRTMQLSLPLCRILTIDQLSAIIAHELAHFKGNDTSLSRNFYPAYRSATATLTGLYKSLHSGIRYLLFMPAIRMIEYFFKAFTKIERSVSRDRELIADAVAAQLSGNQTVAITLTKLHAFSKAWENTVQSVRYYAGENKPLTNISEWFVSSVKYHTKTNLLIGLDSQQLPHPTDTHPPLSARLYALGISMETVAIEAQNAICDQPAVQLIHEYEVIEKQLSGIMALCLRMPFKQAIAKAKTT